jgi:hypothetical protein
MPGLSTVKRDATLNDLKGTASYLALYSSATGPGSEGTELTGGSYARVLIAATTGWGSISTVSGKRRMSNSGTLTFPTASANQGTATHMALMSLAAAGTRFWYGQLAEPLVITTGKVATFGPGTVVVEIE